MTGRFPIDAVMRDGSRVLLRPIESGDAALLLAGFERLSPESRYRRFLAPTARLTGTQVAYLTQVDHRDHEAIIAIAAETGEGIGVARYVRLANRPDVAEAAVTVVDDWQGRGLATALLSALIARAREEDIDRFAFLVLAKNDEMIDLIRGLGPFRELAREGSTVEFELELPGAAEGIGPQLAAMLQRAATEALRLLPRRQMAPAEGREDGAADPRRSDPGGGPAAPPDR